MDRFPPTLSLTLGAAVVFLIVGLGTGMLAAVEARHAWSTRSPAGASLVLSSMQIYFLGPIALALLVYSSRLLDQPKYMPFTENPVAWFIGLLHPVAGAVHDLHRATTPVWRAPR